MSSNSDPARKSAKQQFPARNVLTLGHGARRQDGRLAERRRPSSAKLSNQALRNEARRIPFGTGGNLTDRQRMILCYLPNTDRHKRATRVFNQRGEWYTNYRYMTTMDDAFLAMCDIPRMYVPRTANDRPTNRNEGQVKLEEVDAARRRASLGLRAFHSASDKQQFILHLEVTLIPDLIEEDARRFFHPDGLTSTTSTTVTIDLKRMGYEDVCSAILKAFYLDEPIAGVPEMYVGTVLARWVDPATGNKDVRKVYDYNWQSEIVPFITFHPMTELSIAFGAAVAEEFDEEDKADEECGYGGIDPILLE